MFDTIKNTYLYLQIFYKCTYYQLNVLAERSGKRKDRTEDRPQGETGDNMRTSLYTQFFHSIEKGILVCQDRCQAAD